MDDKTPFPSMPIPMFIDQGDHGDAEEVVNEERKMAIEVMDATVNIITIIHIPFETETDYASYCFAMGFVVDKERGIILTNRHVLVGGPITVQAKFHNQTQLDSHPVYADPEHDFAFLRYDPTALKNFIFKEIILAPEACCLGLPINLIGNDEARGWVILPGTISSINMPCPQTRLIGEGDSNTFYIQAACGSSSGSSGSPVIDLKGRAVALHCGGSVDGMGSYFLPLSRVVIALKVIQDQIDNETSISGSFLIPRGTIQSIFVHMMSSDYLADMTLELPHGPSYGRLEPGDLLISISASDYEKVLPQFLDLEDILDRFVGSQIQLEVQRNGLLQSILLWVQDFHTLTPTHYLEVFGAIVHPLSYLRAKDLGLPCGLPYVADPGYLLRMVPRGSIIMELNGEQTRTLDAFVCALSKLARGDRADLGYSSGHLMTHCTLLICENDWYPFPKYYYRDSQLGGWTNNGVLAFEFKQKHPTLGRREILGFGNGDQGCLEPECKASRTLRHRGLGSGDQVCFVPDCVKSSLVTVMVSTPPNCTTEESLQTCSSVTGLIIHLSDQYGLIVVDKTNIGIMACDIQIKFPRACSQIRGQVVFIHPIHNFSIVGYNPDDLTPPGSVSPIRPAKLCGDPGGGLRMGHEVYVVGLEEYTSRLSFKKCAVMRTHDPPLNDDTYDVQQPPRYKPSNMEVIELDTEFRHSGVIANAYGEIVALWGQGSKDDMKKGFPVYPIFEVLQSIKTGRASGSLHCINNIRIYMPDILCLDVELDPLGLEYTYLLGLMNDRIKALSDKDPVRLQVLQVRCCYSQSNLQAGDLILEINSHLVTCFGDVEAACKLLSNERETLSITVLREKKERHLNVRATKLNGHGIRSVVSWCGGLFHAKHREAGRFFPEHGGVYIGRKITPLSPLSRTLCPFGIVRSVNGQNTPNLDLFLKALQVIINNFTPQVWIQIFDANGQNHDITITMDHSWPTFVFNFSWEKGEWSTRTIVPVLEETE